MCTLPQTDPQVGIGSEHDVREEEPSERGARGVLPQGQVETREGSFGQVSGWNDGG